MTNFNIINIYFKKGVYNLSIMNNITTVGIKKACKICKKVTNEIYQNQTCKSCLMGSFQEMISFIDLYREQSNGHEKMYSKSAP